MNTTNYAPKHEKKGRGKKIAIGAAVVIGLAVVGTALSGSDTGTDTQPSGLPESSVSVSVEPTLAPDEAPAEEPAPDEVAPAEQAEADLPREFKNADGKAQSYLKSGHFSEEGLYGQLTSQFEEYSPEAAQYAVDQVPEDVWQEQTIKAAESYLSWSDMSYSGLYDQLLFEKHTPEHAQAAVDTVY